MSAEVHAHSDAHAAGHHDGHDDHHHDEPFVYKYIFSMDHKVISRQFLITAVIMATLAMGMSFLFRLQLACRNRRASR